MIRCTRCDKHVARADTENHLGPHRVVSRDPNTLTADRNRRARTVRSFDDAGETIFKADDGSDPISDRTMESLISATNLQQAAMSQHRDSRGERERFVTIMGN